MKLRISMTLLLLVLLIIAAMSLAPGPQVLAEPPSGTSIQYAAPAP